MKDLSPDDAISALCPTSQAGGNMTASNANALTAPGSPPVDPRMPPAKQGEPAITPSRPEISVGSNGKPTPKTAMPASRPAWVKTSTA